MPPDELTPTATADGRLLLDGQPIAEPDLASAVRDRQVLFFEAGQSRSYAPVVDLLDACRSADIARIGVVTRENRSTS
jgi:biopolymer transport protein ExbD